MVLRKPKGVAFVSGRLQCKTCVAARAARQATPKGRDARLRRTYSITLEQFDRMLRDQHNACRICKEPFSEDRKPYVDHNNACCSGPKPCGKCVCGLLCDLCNKALGFLHDDSVNAFAAYNYLKETRAESSPQHVDSAQ